MGIAKFDDGIPDNPKFISAGPVASWLWFCGVLYCRRALTDGFIPRQKIPTLVVGLAQPYKHAATLVTVNLWNEATGGYQVHDYLEWNPTKVTVEAYRRKDKERKHKQNPDRIPDGFQSGSGKDSERRGASHAGATSKSEPKSTSEDLDLRRGEETDQGKPIRATAHVGLVGKHQLTCRPGTWDACARGFCVPPFVADEWRVSAEAAGLDVDAEIRACVADTLAAHVGVLAGDPSKFWRAAWAVRHGDASQTLAPRGRSRTDDTIDAGKEHLRRQLAEFQAEEGGPHVKRSALES